MLIIGTFDVLTKLLLFVRKFIVVSIVVVSIDIVVGINSFKLFVDIVVVDWFVVVSSLTIKSSFIIGSDDRTDEDIELTAFVGLLLFIDVVRLLVVVVTSVVNVVVHGVIINEGEDDEIQFNVNVAEHGREIADNKDVDFSVVVAIVVVVVNKPVVDAVVDDVVFVVLLFAVVELAARSRPPVFCCCSRCNLKYLLN